MVARGGDCSPAEGAIALAANDGLPRGIRERRPHSSPNAALLDDGCNSTRRQRAVTPTSRTGMAALPEEQPQFRSALLQLGTCSAATEGPSGSMAHFQAELSRIQVRLARLERERGLWKAMCFLILVLLVGSLLSSSPLLPSHVAEQHPTAFMVVQRSNDSNSGYKLPRGETPISLVDFMNKRTGTLRYELASGTLPGPFVYVSMASANRFEEMLLDRKQVNGTAHVDAFLFIWTTSSQLCREQDLHKEIRHFMQKEFGAKENAVSFICWFNGFSETEFTNNSLQLLEEQLAPRATIESFPSRLGRWRWHLHYALDHLRKFL
mmetsp:Transcript_90601/g.194268  ORF Transcript_90601/g.194268 Transcript_90601/m.194268 type:complete len:322 (+) Transcript_90601:96-1061(+)